MIRKDWAVGGAGRSRAPQTRGRTVHPPLADPTVFGRRGRVALPPVLSLPLVSLLLTPLALPALGVSPAVRRLQHANTTQPI